MKINETDSDNSDSDSDNSDYKCPCLKEEKEEDDLSLSKIELEDEKEDNFPTTTDLQKLVNLINELKNMLILTKMSDKEIQTYISDNLTEEAKQIKEQYKKYIKVLPSSNIIRQETYAILLKLGICKPTVFVVEEKSV